MESCYRGHTLQVIVSDDSKLVAQMKLTWSSALLALSMAISISRSPSPLAL